MEGNTVTQATDPSEIRFAADRMLGRLARMLRMLGYDTHYSPQVTPSELMGLARRDGRTVLTRGETARRFPGLANVFNLASDSPAEQLQEVVKRFHLDTRAGLWTRCTLCNGPIQRVEKPAIKPLVPPRVFELYEDFYRCAACEHVYWRGSHLERILQNLRRMLGE